MFKWTWLYLGLIFSMLVSGLGIANETHVAIVLDRSGSMAQKRLADGKSRCLYSKEIARDLIQRLEKDSGSNTHINILLFGSSGMQESLTNGFVPSTQQALMALESLGDESCNKGNTALADSICLAAEDLRKQYMGFPGKLIIWGTTDGDENDSRSHICGSGEGSDWKDKVRKTVTAQWPRITFNVAIFYSNVRNNIELEENSEDPRSAQATFEFLRSLAQETGGEILEVPDDKVVAIMQKPMMVQELFFIYDDLSRCHAASKFTITTCLPNSTVINENYTLETEPQKIILTAKTDNCDLQITCSKIPFSTLTALAYQNVCENAYNINEAEKTILISLRENLNFYQP